MSSCGWWASLIGQVANEHLGQMLKPGIEGKQDGYRNEQADYQFRHAVLTDSLASY